MNALQGLAAAQIKKHGKDRYPSVQFQVLKLVEEVGELAAEVLKADWSVGATQPPPRVVSELADVMLAAAEVANKLRVDILSVVGNKVDGDGRTFS